MRRWRILAGVAVAAMLLGGCTLVPTASSPEVIPDAQIPYALLSPTIPGTTIQNTIFCPALNLPALGRPAPISPPPWANQSMSRISGKLWRTQTKNISTTPIMNGKATKLCAYFPAVESVVNISLTTSGNNTLLAFAWWMF